MASPALAGLFFPDPSRLRSASFGPLTITARAGPENLQLLGVGRVAQGPTYGRSGHGYGTSGASEAHVGTVGNIRGRPVGAHGGC